MRTGQYRRPNRSSRVLNRLASLWLRPVMIGLVFMSGCSAEKKHAREGVEAMAGEVSSQEMSELFQPGVPIEEVNEWKIAPIVDQPHRFERILRIRGSQQENTVVAVIGRGRAAGQRERFVEINNAVTHGRMTVEKDVGFGLKMLHADRNSYRQYFVGNNAHYLFCTYEGVNAPQPFVRCSWSRDQDAFLVEAAPAVISYILTNIDQIERLTAEQEGN